MSVYPSITASITHAQANTVRELRAASPHTLEWFTVGQEPGGYPRPATGLFELTQIKQCLTSISQSGSDAWAQAQWRPSLP